jgi:hypothetical protein
MKKIILSLVLAFGLFIVPTVFAEEPTGLAQLAGCSGPDCSLCNVADMANGIIKWLIGILFMVFALLLAIAGVRLVTSGGNHHALDEAKSSFTNAIIGFIIILSAWLIVDTIMRVLVGTDANPGSIVETVGSTGSVSGYLYWSEVQCQEHIVPGYSEVEQQIVEYKPESISDANPVVSNPVTGVTGANCPAAPESNVVSIPGTRYKARPEIVSNFQSMKAAAAADGVTLTVTSGWRSEAVQVGIWASHNCDNVSCSGRVARPCSKGGNGSNHNSGNALDISGARGSASYNWLKANGGRYGFYNNLGPDDPFHWSRSGR